MKRRVAATMLLLSGIAFSSQGAWIYGKARLAQLLLELSWRGVIRKPWPWADTQALARLRLDRDGSEIIVLSGASGRNMAFGPAHLDGTARPGQPGNCVITAHRDTHFAPLRYLLPGDTLTLQTSGGKILHYEVKAARIVDNKNTEVLRQDGRTRLTLVTCYPFDAVLPGGPLRFVLIAEPV
jgi:sortase A